MQEPTAAPPAPPPRKPYPGIAQAFLLLLLLWGAMVVLQAGVMAVHLIGHPEALRHLLEQGGDQGLPLVPMLLIGNTGAFLLVLLLGSKLSRSSLAGIFPFHFRAGYVLVFLTLIPACAGGATLISELDNVIRTVLPPGLRDFMGALDRSMFDMIRHSYWPAVAALVIMAPLTEELFFRGLLLHGFRLRYGRTKAMVASAAFFSLAHLTPNQLIPAFLAGIFLAWLLLETRSLWLTLFTHAVFNGTAAISVGLALRSGQLEPPLTPALNPWYVDLGALVVMGIGLAATVLVVRRLPSEASVREV